MNAPPDLVVEGIRIAKPGRVVYPGTGITRADVARYYQAIAPRLLAGIGGRPLSLLRCPDGIAGEHFFQRHPDESWDASVRRVELAEKDGTPDTYLCIDDARGLLELVRLGTLELHVWGATAAAPERPDNVVFDLDPGDGIGWPQVVASARLIRAELRRRGLDSFVRLTGGKGVHVVAPFAPGPAWAEAKAFCESLARDLAARQPDLYVASAAKAMREGRIFIDWLRNTRSATSIANWSLRAREGAPAAMPLRWEELGATASGHDYPLPRALQRAAHLRGEPWAGWMQARRQPLPAA